MDSKLNNMKKKFKDRKFAKIGASILKGALLDPTKPIIGAAVGLIGGFKNIDTENKASETGGVGKNNYVQWFSFGGMVILTGLLAFGKINMETFERILETFERILEFLPASE